MYEYRKNPSTNKFERTDNLLDRRELLKIKLKSLAAEIRIIRQEEQKTHGYLREEMYFHRTKDLRRIARNTGIAYGLIRGRTHDQMEPSRESEPDWDAIKAMIKKYGPKTLQVETIKQAEPQAQAQTV